MYMAYAETQTKNCYNHLTPVLCYDRLLSDLEAYQKENKPPPPVTAELFIAVVYFKSQGYAGTQKSWDGVLRRACPNLQLTGRSKKWS